MVANGSITGGSVVWNFDADQRDFDNALDEARGKVDQFSKDLDKNSKTTRNWASELSGSFNTIADGLGKILKASAVLATAGSFGFVAMAKASFEQVRQVENATFALKAYEKSGKKVNDVLANLVKYARSDLGVLFQRQDLFDAASTLKIYGVETNNLVGYVKTLSKGVAIGKTSFQELSEVLGRTVAEGKLTSDTFDILVRRGIKLPDTMRNAAVSGKELFKALDKALPDKLLKGRANTIDGAMIRLQSAFRDLGGAILGVDAETSKFTKGGAGDRLVKLFENLRETLRDPAVTEAFKELGKGIANLAETLIPMLLNGIIFIAKNMDTIGPALGAITAMFVAAKVAAIGFGIYGAIAVGTMTAPMLLVAAAVTTVIGVLTFLQLKFKIFNKIADAAKVVLGFLKDRFNDVKDAIGFVIDKLIEARDTAFSWIKDRLDDINEKLSDFKDWLKENKDQIKTTAKVLGVIFGPALAKAGTQAVIAGAKIAGSGFVAAGGWIIAAGSALLSWTFSFGSMIGKSIITAIKMSANGIKAGIGWIAAAADTAIIWTIKFALMAGKAILTAIVIAAQAAIAGYAWVLHAGLSAVAWIANFLLMKSGAISTAMVIATQAAIAGYAWVKSAALASAGVFKAALRIAASWLIALGPIGLIIAAVAGAVALIIMNWDKVKSAFQAVWNWVKDNWPMILAILIGPIGLAVLAITKNWNKIKEGASKLWNGIKKTFSAVGGFFSNTFKKAWDAVKNAFGSVGSFFSNVWNIIKSKFKSIGSTVGNAIGGAFKKVVNSILGFAENTINGFIRAINGAINTINKIPKVNISHINELNIPKLAKGGPVTSGKPYLIGEKGPELFVPNTNGQIISNDKLDNSKTGQTMIEYHISEINISKEVDGERWIQKLTRDQEIISDGLIPSKGAM